MSRGKNAGNRGQGSKWIRHEKRLRIYERDSWLCVWCSAEVSNDMVGDAYQEILSGEPFEIRLATLDHVVPRSDGGTNEAYNLLTCCAECNYNRGNLSVLAMAVAQSVVKKDRKVCVDSNKTIMILDRIIAQIEKPLK